MAKRTAGGCTDETGCAALAQPAAGPPIGKAPPIEKAPPRGAAGEGDAFCVYLGPSIRGHILNGAVFKGRKAEVLAQLGPAVERHPLVAGLVVPGGELPEARAKANAPGNLLNERFARLLKTLKGGSA